MGGEDRGGRNFLDLPEDCVADVFSLTSPRDTCRLSTVSSKFRDLLQSDTVWDRFLPSDFNSIISQSSDSSLLNRFPSKKQLYLSLCDNPIIIEHGRKSFALEKVSGKKTYMISARDLKIAWGDTPSYWRWNSNPDSRFGEVAELICVCWFDISGKINTQMLSPATRYEAYLVYQSTGAHGFEYHPTEATVGLAGTEGCKLTVYLIGERGGNPRRYQMVRRIGWLRRNRILELQGYEGDREVQYPRTREDGWIEVKLGEFFNKEGQDGDLEISILEVKSGFWKRGILVQGIEIRPTNHCTGNAC
ncbi:putative F-box protein PP2-B12 [Euphorbia lathyris]|uniref:putative F-box protein PP2-B12 n=1 Tax=Euphorbia lathyris TaxID=212925 RepID=UPI0033130B95